MKAVKFGGTSMATAEAVRAVMDIIKSDANRRIVVVSAPGKTKTEGKVTDMLIDCATKSPNERVAAFECVRARFNEITKGLNIEHALDDAFAVIEKNLPTQDMDYIVSRGEYLSAKLLAKAIGFEFIDAAEIIKFNESGVFDSERTQEICSKRLSRVEVGAVIPGFYGATDSGKTVTFSRGGSDVSGAIAARAISASVYENFTDVDGFMSADPRIVFRAQVISVITYKELRELSYMGANVLHPESIFPVRKALIPIHVLNTFNPAAQGTLIVPTERYLKGEYKRQTRNIVGVAGKKDFSALYIEKSMMNSEVGFAAKVLNCFSELGINMEHMPSGIDTLTVVYETLPDEVQAQLEKLITVRLNPDTVSVSKNLSLIAVVGHDMVSQVGSASRITQAMTDARINIRMIDQGSSEMNIILAVDNSDYSAAIRALHSAMIEKS